MKARQRKTGHGEADNELRLERSRHVERQYADILTTIGEAAAKAGTPRAGKLLMETGKTMRRIAAGLHLDTEPLIGGDAALYRLTYVSFATERHPARLLEEANAIALTSSARNAADGITGALSVGGGWYAQVLEGPSRPLIALFDRILCDPRHEDIRVLDFGPIESRQFSLWSMAYSGEVAPQLVRRAVADYAEQELRARAFASESGIALAAAMSARLVPFAAAAE